MKPSDLANPKQKEILAQFYSNLALVILAAGVITPLFTGIGKIDLFNVRFISAIVFSVIALNYSLKFLK